MKKANFIVSLFAVLFLSNVLHAEPIEFCFKDGNAELVSFAISEDVENETITLSGSNIKKNTVSYSKRVVTNGEEAQVDSDLIQEEVKESIVWSWNNKKTGEEGFFAVIEGVSGTKYYIDVIEYRVKADTKTCLKK